jgi:steroid 5-alpha reductase family enzyme
MPSYPWADLALNLGLSAAAIVVYIAAIMAYSIATRNHSIIDIFWGPGFVLVAVVSYLASIGSEGDDLRRLLILVLTAVWGLRLGLYIGRRNRGHGQDPRYTALMRHQTGSLIGYLIRKIYGLQGVLLFVVSLPLQVAVYERQSIGVLGTLGVIAWVIGFAFEAVGDWQLARFKADPANAGQVMDRGLWAWTRHPNYFGDAMVWIGLWLLSLGNPIGIVTVISPIVMTKLLVSFSGKALLEKGMRRSKGAAYEDYIARTSGFIPRPPRRRAPDAAPSA